LVVLFADSLISVIADKTECMCACEKFAN